MQPGPYDPHAKPVSPNPDPILPGHTPMEVPVRQPSGIPDADPNRAPAGTMDDPDAGQSNPSPIG